MKVLKFTVKTKIMIEKIFHNDILLSIIIQSGYCSEGIKFFTPDNFSQQLAYMKREKDYVIAPHVHCAQQRNVHITQEVLFIKTGKVRVDSNRVKIPIKSNKLINNARLAIIPKNLYL